jgi:hypothetical protein
VYVKLVVRMPVNGHVRACVNMEDAKVAERSRLYLNLKKLLKVLFNEIMRA